MIVAGFLKHGRLIFYKADQLAELEQATSPGVYVIGTGGEYAMDHLTWRGQNADCSLTRSLLHVHEALEKARSRDRCVGKASDYIIIHKNGKQTDFRQIQIYSRVGSGHTKSATVRCHCRSIP